jgi:mono/diheme cytochrome c family protein
VNDRAETSRLVRIALLTLMVAGAVMFARPLTGTTNDPPFQPRLPDRTLQPQGRYVFQRNCAVCHGAFGDGRGEMGREIQPRPRDFNRGLFKYRSTPPGKLPTDEDLERTIRDGLAGTAMPMFQNLTDREIQSVIEYVKSFSSRWRQATNYAPALRLPPLPEWFQDGSIVKKRAEKGRSLFATACAACHGPSGDGHGVATATLEDVWGERAVLSDLRQPALRSGGSLEAIYRVVWTGIEGAPMPAFAETLAEDQRWELVAFIAQLRREHSESK